MVWFLCVTPAPQTGFRLQLPAHINCSCAKYKASLPSTNHCLDNKCVQLSVTNHVPFFNSASDCSPCVSHSVHAQTTGCTSVPPLYLPSDNPLWRFTRMNNWRGKLDPQKLKVQQRNEKWVLEVKLEVLGDVQVATAKAEKVRLRPMWNSSNTPCECGNKVKSIQHLLV